MNLTGFGRLSSVKNQEGTIFSRIYDILGRLDTILNPDSSSRTFDYKIGLPDSIFANYDTTDQDYLGLCLKATSTDEIGLESRAYYDALGRLRKTAIDSTSDSSSLDIITKYEYYDDGNLKYVIHPNNDTTKYWYDNFGRVLYKYQTDVGYLSYQYDKIGQLRFAQTTEQADSNKVSFFQYDDIGRTTVVGEAQVDITGLEVHEPDFSDPDDTFARLTDKIDPNELNYLDYGSGADKGIPTANRTLFNSSVVRQLLNIYQTNSLPDTSFFSNETAVGPYLAHLVSYYQEPAVIADYDDFEDIGQYPEFVRAALWYDELPPVLGNVWGHFPEHAKWDSLAPTSNGIQNLIGRQSTAAYRGHGGENFHFVVMSYDPRGRIEALLRYTENIGFDAVYYTYNSMNKVISVKTSDPLRTHQTWFSYDDNGRLDTVWTLLGDEGSGIDLDTLRYPNDLTKPIIPEITYSYNKLNGLDSINYIDVDITKKFYYSSRGWLDSLIARRQFDTIFYELLERDLTGNITEQKSKNRDNDEIIQTYEYDNIGRITEWAECNSSLSYTYDIMGNRMAKGSDLYAYDAAKTNRLRKVDNGVFVQSYQYNSNGAVRARLDSVEDVELVKASFYYTPGGLLKRYVDESFGEFPCTDTNQTTYKDNTFDWRYRYSPLGGREQKRLYYSPHGDGSNEESCDYTHPWVYYQLGAGGQQLSVWHGRQSNKDMGDSTGRRVYMYPEEYFVAGGTVSLRPDTSKQVRIKDHLGSVRAIVTKKDATVTYKFLDYSPFGSDLGPDTPGDGDKITYGGFENNAENSYIQMGVRTYDPNIGRFLSIDPLFEIYTEYTPYHYVNSSPLIHIDPSGMSMLKLIEAAVLAIVEFFSDEYCMCGEKWENHTCPVGGGGKSNGSSSSASGGSVSSPEGPGRDPKPFGEGDIGGDNGVGGGGSGGGGGGGFEEYVLNYDKDLGDGYRVGNNVGGDLLGKYAGIGPSKQSRIYSVNGGFGTLYIDGYYAGTSSGLDWGLLQFGYTDNTGLYSNIRSIQTVYTNAPLLGMTLAEAKAGYNDPAKGTPYYDNEPYYHPSNRFTHPNFNIVKAKENWEKDIRGLDYFFFDKARRFTNIGDYYWRATNRIVGTNFYGVEVTLVTIRWGYRVIGGKPKMYPLYLK